MWQLLPPMALLFIGDLPKAVLSLDPPWYRVLEKDNVTLKCQGTNSPGKNDTEWWHNGTLISDQTSSYLITSASKKDSGEYKCKTGLSTLSDPVQLEVHTGWLLLQVLKLEFQEGEKIMLRCHSWKNKPVHKVTYLQDGRGKKYFHYNSNLYIPKATYEDSGSYFCRGLIGSKNISSESVNITVKGVLFTL
ncbi:low affinity immunoglobulin gamma Fc region receptor III-A-like [Rhynchocyon petersi]